MRFTTDGLARLFGLDDPLARRLRNGGMALINQIGPLKRAFDPSSLGLTEISSREKTMLRILFAAALLCAGSAWHKLQHRPSRRNPPARPRNAQDTNHRGSDKAKVEARVGAKPDSVTRMPFGLYEVILGTDILYVDPNVKTT